MKEIFFRVFSATKILATLFSILLSMSAFADVSPLCNDLARYSCAPGNYKDQTGSVKSASEIQRFMSGYAEKTRQQLNEKFKTILNNPDNSYFKDLAISGLGLKSSPQCNSKDQGEQNACRENLIDGLTTLAQKQALSPLMPTASLARMANLSDVSYIMQNENYQNVISDLNKQAGKDLSNPEVEKKIKEKIFPEVKALLVERLNKLSVSEEQKKFMINKIKSIQFAGSNCTELNGNGSSGNEGGSQVVTSLLTPNAFYYSARNTFKFCSGFLLQSTSEFQIAMTIGHELSHSIDPCEIAFGPADMGFKYKNSDDLKKMEQEYPLKNVVSCLRDPKSIEAKNLTAQKQGQMGQYGGGGTYPMPNGSSYPTYPAPSGGYGEATAQAAQPKPSFCNNDQVTESFADWMGTEVLPQYIAKNYKLSPEQYREGYANADRVNCWAYPDTSDNFNYEVHPAIGKRINKILLVNPAVRSQMGCPVKHPENVYCDSEHAINSPPVEATAIKNTTQPTGAVQ